MVWEGTNVLVVPTSALVLREGEWRVFVVYGGRPRLRTVKVGHRGTEVAEVLSGLEEREEVVLFASMRWVRVEAESGE